MAESQAKNVAATLRAIRSKLDLTQEQLAERLGVSFATVNRWEGGSTLPQKAAQEVIAALAQEVGLSPEDGATGDTAAPAAGVTRRRRSASAAPPRRSPWSRCSGMPLVRFAAKRTRPGSRTTCFPS